MWNNRYTDMIKILKGAALLAAALSLGLYVWRPTKFPFQFWHFCVWFVIWVLMAAIA